jgi:hypothetical protein
MRRSMLIGLALVCMLGGRAGADDSAKAVIEKAVKAHGGQENLNRYRAVEMKCQGTIFDQGMEIGFTGRIAGQLPDKFREELNLEFNGRNIAAIRVFDGKRGWDSNNGQTEELTGAKLNGLKDEAYENYIEVFLPLLSDKRFKVALIGDDKVEDKPAVGVKVSAKGHKDVKLYFDKESGMLVKSVHTMDRDMREQTTEAFFYDYKPVHGAMVAMKQITNRDGKKFIELKVNDCNVREKLDDSTFAKP